MSPLAPMAPTGLVESLLAAVQASLSVLLVISYGGLASWLNLLSSANTKAISKVCVRMFLPALLITKIGSQLRAESADRYGLILIWAMVCHAVSFAIGIGAHLLLGMPEWTTVAVMFNNTTSYPLLLIAALDETGILKSLVVTDESTSEAIERAKSYFLVFATVSSCLTFAVGPRLIDTEHPPEPEGDKRPCTEHEDPDEASSAYPAPEPNEETGLLSPRPIRYTDPFTRNSFFPTTRRHTKFHDSATSAADRTSPIVPRLKWTQLGPRARWWLLFVSDFFNAPLLGALAGAVVGLSPALHRAFFNDSSDGGIFTAWLTASLKNVGGLFVPLPIVVAGVSLYTAMREARSSRSSGEAGLPWLTVAFILAVRFVVWPVASIGLIYALASSTDILGPDPMLWFAMMLMPTGPPAMKLIALVQVSDAAEADERNIAKLLTVAYVISPILSFTVVGSLMASQACI